MVIFGDNVLIITDEPNKLQKIHNYLEKSENVFFFHMVVDFLQLIWFAHGDQNKILIATSKLNKLQKIYNHVEKEDILSILQMVVDIP